jgi:16S rRNA (cytidine1402-2'-O)-methyltransferase
VTVLVAGATDAPVAGDAAIDDAIRAALASGQRVREVADAVSGALGVPRREVYRRALALAKPDDSDVE